MPVRSSMVNEGGGALSTKTTNHVPGGMFSLRHAGDTKPFECDGYGGAAITIFGDYGTSPNVLCDRFGGDNVWSPLAGIPTDYLATKLAPTLNGTVNSTYLYSLLGAARFRVRLFNEPVNPYPVVFSVSLIPGVVMPFVMAGCIGAAAHDAVLAGNPVRVAGRALTASYTAVSSGDVADVITTLDGRIITLPGAIPENTWNYAGATGGIVNTTAVTIKTAAASGIRNYLRSLQVINTAATASEFSVRDGAAGTVLFRGTAPASMTRMENFTFDPPLRGTAATLMEVVMATNATATLFNAQGWIAP